MAVGQEQIGGSCQSSAMERLKPGVQQQGLLEGRLLTVAHKDSMCTGQGVVLSLDMVFFQSTAAFSLWL